MKRAYAIRRSRPADWAKFCGGLAVPVLVLAAVGTRVGLVPAPALVPVLVVGFILAVLALGIATYSLIDIWKNGRGGGSAAVAGIVYALPVLVLLGLIAAAAVRYPRLTDVTTSLDDPPEFVAGRAVEGPPATSDLALQHEAYPELVTRLYPAPLGQVYAEVRDIIEARRWTITRDSRPTVMPTARPETPAEDVGETEELIAALAQKSVVTHSRSEVAPPAAGDSAEGARDAGSVATIEAVALTPVFAFRDEVIIRMRGTLEGTEVDMRSASGSGEHDLGQNARRIRAFFAKLDSVLQPEAPASGVTSTRE
ncbi:MAG: DUF1499 domain-containing protein [Propylenella sp.]